MLPDREAAGRSRFKYPGWKRAALQKGRPRSYEIEIFRRTIPQRRAGQIRPMLRKNINYSNFRDTRDH